jgi:hypothetical protein
VTDEYGAMVNDEWQVRTEETQTNQLLCHFKGRKQVFECFFKFEKSVASVSPGAKCSGHSSPKKK